MKKLNISLVILFILLLAGLSIRNSIANSQFMKEHQPYFDISLSSLNHWIYLASPILSYYIFEALPIEKQKEYLMFFTFILAGITITILVEKIRQYIEFQYILNSQLHQKFCQNQMSNEKFRDKSLTKIEVAKLMKTPEFIELMNSRKGQGEAAWNWQKRN